MSILSIDLFITLDGVYQAPGGPDEDREGRFESGGWPGAYFDDETGEAIGAGINGMDALLLGRKTYDIAERRLYLAFVSIPGDNPPRVTLTDLGWCGAYGPRLARRPSLNASMGPSMKASWACVG